MMNFSSSEQWQLIQQLKTNYGLVGEWENRLSKAPPAWMRYRTPSSWSWLRNFLTVADPGILKNWMERGFLEEDPPWLRELLNKHNQRIATIFLVTGNVQDYAFSPAEGYLPVSRLICEEIIRESKDNGSDSPNQVLVYNLASQIHYFNPEKDRILESHLSQYEEERESQGHLRPNDIGDRVQSDFSFFDRLFSMREIDGQPGGVRNLTLVIERAEMLFPPETRDLHRNLMLDMLLEWANRPEMFLYKHRIILLAENIDDVSQYLKSKTNKISLVDVGRPDENLRLKFLYSVRSSSSKRAAGLLEQPGLRFGSNNPFPSTPPEMRLEQLAQKASGLNFTGLEDLLLQSGGFLKEETVIRLKGKILQEESSGLLELVETNKTFDKDVGGLEAIKERLREVSHALRNADSSEVVRRTIPMGILFLGPPGTGKTQVAQAFAGECGANFVKLGDFRSMWVGETERNLSKALYLIKTLSPVIVFMDELDQTEGSRGEQNNDSGVNKRVFGKLLQFMSDTSLRGKVLWIAASNRPDLIDPALKRAGRFDMSIPFFPPEPEEVLQILHIHLGLKKGDKASELIINLNENEWHTLVGWLSSDTEKYYTGAEIELIVNETIRRALREKNRPELCLEDFKNTIDSYQPSRVNYQQIIDSTLREVSFLDYLPPSWYQKRKELLENHEQGKKIDPQHLEFIARLLGEWPRSS